MINISIRCPTFYSAYDEDVFFTWLKSISCVVDIVGYRRRLNVHIENIDITDEQLRELLSLFQRYNIRMKALEVFLNDKNAIWFQRESRAFWHKKIWG